MLRDSQYAIEAEADALRDQLRASLSELSYRSTPSHLLQVVQETALEKGRAMLGEGMSLLRSHGAAAGVAGAGAILAFDLGRRSVPQSEGVGVADDIGGAQVRSAQGQKGIRAIVSQMSDSALAWFSGLAGAAVGGALGAAVPITPQEREVFAALPAQSWQEIDDFKRRHMQGMKQTAAEAFGIARFSAWMLVAMAIAADKLKAPAAKL